MKERFLESFAILLAGLFSAERQKPWSLGQKPRSDDAGQPPADEHAAARDKN